MNWKNIPVNDEKWSCMVTLLAEEHVVDKFLVTSFENSYHPKLIVNLNRKVLRQHFLWGGVKRSSHYLPASRNDEKSKPATGHKHSVFKQDAKEIKNYILKVRDLMLFRIAAHPKKELFCSASGFPSPGPHVYFVLTGFKDVNLIVDLLEANVPVNLAISVHFEWKTIAAKNWLEEMVKERGSIDSKKAGTSITSQSSKVAKFQFPGGVKNSYWDDLDELIRNHPQKELFNNFIVVPYKVQEIKNAPIEMYGQVMFDAVKLLMFRWVDQMRIYIHYMNDASIIEIPTAQVNDLLVIPYQLMLEMMPLENTTIELILFCMVEVIVEKAKSTCPSLKSSVLIEESKSFQESDLGEQPVLLHYKDKIGIEYVDIDSTGFDLMEIHINTYKNMPYSMVWRYYEEQDAATRISKQSHLYKLWKCGDVKMPFDMFQLHLHQMIFTKLINLSEKNDETSNEEFSKIAFKFEEMSIEDKDNMKLSKFHHCRELLSMFDYNVKGYLFNSLRAEELKTDLILQCLQDAFNKYNWSYYHYLTLTDKMVFWFKNEFNYEGPTTSELFLRLDTNVSFREFHFLPKKEKWLEINRDKIREADELARKSFIHRFLPNCEIDEKSAEKLQFPLPPIRKNPMGRRLMYDTESLIIDEEIGKFVSYEGPIVTIRRDNRELSETITVDSFGNTFVFKISTSDEEEAPVKSLFIQANNGIIFNLDIERIKTVYPDATGKKAPRIETEVKLDVVTTLPNGLTLNFVKVDEQICVYQKYLYEELYWYNGVKERLRVCMNNGTVIQFMLNGDISILHQDSTVTTIYEVHLMTEKELMMSIDLMTQIIQMEKERERAASVKAHKARKNTFELKKGAKSPKKSEPKKPSSIPQVRYPSPSRLKIIEYDKLDWCGVRWTYKDNQLCEKRQECKLRAAHNLGRELYVKRGDISTSFYKYDGTLHFKYADGTLITSIPREIRIDPSKILTTPNRATSKQKTPSQVEEPNEDEEFIGFENEYLQEHPKYVRVHFKKSDICSVRLEESTCMTRNGDGTYFIHLDETTTVQIGKELITIKSKRKDEHRNVTVTEINLQNGSSSKLPIFKCTDSLMRALCVYPDGKFECVCLDESINAKDSVAKDMLYTNRFFVVGRDLSGWEFVPDFCDNSGQSTIAASENLASVVEEEIHEEEEEEEEEKEEEEEEEQKEEIERNMIDDVFNVLDSSTSYLDSSCDLSSTLLDSPEDSLDEETVDYGDELKFKVEINNKKLFRSKTQRFDIPYKFTDYKMTFLKKKDLSHYLPLSFKWLFALTGNHYYGTPAIERSWENQRKEVSSPNRHSKPLAVLYERYHTTDTYADMYKLYKSAFINYLNYHKEIFELYKQYLENPTFYYFDDVVVPEPTINVKALIHHDDQDGNIQELLRAKKAITSSLVKII